MSKSPLEEAFNLPSINEIQNEMDDDKDEIDIELEDETDSIDDVTMTEDELAASLNSLNSKLSEVSDIGLPREVTSTMDDYMDNINEIHSLALGKFKDLIDGVLAMEASQGAKFLVGAVKLLDIAKDAQNSSMDRVMRMAKLQIEREKHDIEKQGLVKRPKAIGDVVGDNQPDGDTSNDAVIIEDRNVLLEQLRKKNNG